ncbi:MAG: nucleotidyltransferase domain-containing protein [Archaeoglobaceae archaeon]
MNRLFSSRTRVKILTLFLMNPGEEVYVREIARRVEENINAVRRELENLEGVGLLKSEKKGNLKYYTTNRNFPIYDELSSIILKTEGVAKFLRGRLVEMGIEVAFIYGSFASGEATAESDIDLFLIGHVREEEVVLEVREVEKKLSREVNYVLFTPQEFKERVKNEDPFVRHVLNEAKTMLIGSAV